MWHVPKAQQQLTPDRYHLNYKPGRIEPVEAVIIHYTASKSAKGTASWLAKKDSHYVSSHFIIARDGTVMQLARTRDRTFHAGGASSKLYGRGNVNGRTLGIELMNIGPLSPKGGQFEGLVDAYGKDWDGAVVEEQGFGPLGHEVFAWEPFPPAQLVALYDLSATLCKEFPVLRLRAAFFGHSEVDPTRKMDPGGAFPWDSFYFALSKVQL